MAILNTVLKSIIAPSTMFISPVKEGHSGLTPLLMELEYSIIIHSKFSLSFDSYLWGQFFSKIFSFLKPRNNYNLQIYKAPSLRNFSASEPEISRTKHCIQVLFSRLQMHNIHSCRRFGKKNSNVSKGSTT